MVANIIKYIWLPFAGLFVQLIVPVALLFIMLMWGPYLIISAIRAQADFVRRNASYLKAHNR